MNSHIIPEFFYKSMYDDKHRFLELIDFGKSKDKIHQKGFREKLLCSSCETQLSINENYVSKVFSGKESLDIKTQKNHLLIKGLKYEAFKLCCISIIWRLGASSLKQFKHVDLGPHQERLRIMILSNTAGGHLDYPFIVSALTLGKKRIPDIIIPPRLSRMEGHSIWQIVVGGFLFFFYTSSHPPKKKITTHISTRGWRNQNTTV